jgi:hypothetical protein
VSVKLEDLNAGQRRTFEMWRSVGLSEERALDAMVEDGAVRLSDRDRAARSLRKIFGLTEGQAEVGARGRDVGSSSRPVSGGAPVVEDNITWHRRMMRELAEMDRELAEVAEAQRARLVREIAGDIARIQAAERRRLQAEERRSSGRCSGFATGG